jgi:hypothetical protein
MVGCCGRCERPSGRRHAEQRDELAPSKIEHGLPHKALREPVFQLTAPSGCRGRPTGPWAGPELF